MRLHNSYVVPSATPSRKDIQLTPLHQENWEMANGPLSILQTAVRSHAQVLISIRSNRKLYVLLSLRDISMRREISG